MSPTRAGVKVVGSGAPDLDDDVLPPDEPPPPPDRAAPRRRPSPLVVVLAVVALLGVFGSVFFYAKYRSASHSDAQQKAVTKTSNDFLLALTNFDASTVDADFTRVESFATGDFASQAQSFFSTDVRKALAKVKAASRGQIRSLYVESLSGSDASVYAEVDQTINNLNFTRPEQDELRIVLSLKKLSPGWRISEVTVLQAPAVPTPGTTSSPSTTAAP